MLTYWTIRTFFHYKDYFVIGEIRTCFGVFHYPMLPWISSNSCPLNLLLVRSHQPEIIIVKGLIQGRNYKWPGCWLNPDHSIRVVIKTTPLPIRPRCLLLYYPNVWGTSQSRSYIFFNKTDFDQYISLKSSYNQQLKPFQNLDFSSTPKL